MNEPVVRLESDLITGPLVSLWGVLLDIADRMPDVWTLIGGQMVLLHGLEHGRTPPGASQDLDVLADVISHQQSLLLLVDVLKDLGFQPAGITPEGKVYRYTRIDADGTLTVDVLAPDKLGNRADLTTSPPGVTLEVPAGRQALHRTTSVSVQLDGRPGAIRRPSLLGAIVGKAAALGIPTAPKAKHYRDLAFLLSLPVNPLSLRSELSKSDRKKLALAKELSDPNHRAWRELRDPDAEADGQAVYRILTRPA
ncbi:hypothetical protein [Streptomyces sp.]|uniref:hypothetical protein n=1 Tax=Streptomyces sp. TaxID=1931 RepID=UPI002F3F4398